MRTRRQAPPGRASLSAFARRCVCVLAVAFTAACGGSSSGDGASCDTHMGTVHMCWDYSGASAMTEATGTCAVSSGTLVDSCSTTNRLGTCSLPTASDGLTTTIFFYSDGGETAALAQNECQQNGGTWTSGS